MSRIIGIILILLLVMIPVVHAQNDVFEIPAIASGDVVSDSFEDNVTSHLYAFYGSAGDSVNITMTQDSDDLDPFLVLISSEGAVLAYDDDGGSSMFAAAIEDLSLDEDGVYFVIATSFLFVDGSETDTNSTLDYSLSISGQTTPANVDDDSVVSVDVDALSIGDSVAGDSDSDAPVSIFYLNASAGDTATITLESDGFFTMLHVFAPDGSRVAVDASLASIELEEDGLYIIIATDQFFYEAIDNGGLFEGGSFVLVIE